MEVARHYYCPDHNNAPIQTLDWIGAWQISDGDPHTDSGVIFVNKTEGIESRNVLDRSDWETHRERMEKDGWVFGEAYGHGCQTDDIIVATKYL